MLRGIIAKRVSRLKQAGAELPIISETPLPATVLSVAGFYQPTLSVYERMSLRDIVGVLRNLPQVVYGSVYGEEAGRWYSVKYPKPIKEAVPVAIGVARTGRITPRVIPKISDIPSISITRPSDISFKEIIRIKRHDFNSAEYCHRVGDGARNRAKKLVGVPWPLSLIWDWVCDNFVYYVYYSAWYVSGWILNVLWDSFVQPQIDKVRNSINSVVSDANTKINLQFGRFTTAFGTAVNESNKKINNQLARIQDAVNLRLEDLYNIWGIPKNMAVTPLHIRNATQYGFEFQSYGKCTAYWIAMGKTLS